MRRILLVAMLIAVAAPASADDTVIWTGEVSVEKWIVGDEQKEYYGYWRVADYGDILGNPTFMFGGLLYDINLFYITNTPRSLLVGNSPQILPTDRSLAWLVDGQRFELADHDRSFPDQDVAVWDNSGLDWEDGQVVSVQLVQATTPVPTLPAVGAVLLVVVLLVKVWRTMPGVGSDNGVFR